MDAIPIVRVGDILLVAVEGDMDDRQAVALQDALAARVVKDRARGVLIDISALEVVDSFIGRMLGSIAAMTRMLGAEAAVVGMQAAVAMTIVELGLPLENVLTALSVDKGVALLHSRLQGSAAQGSERDAR